MSDEKKISFISAEDLLGLSEPLTKLIDVLAAGMGNASRPISIVLEGKAEANRIRTLALAQGEAIRTLAGARADAGRVADQLERERAVARLEYEITDIRKRAELRAAAEAITQQENLERIAASAAQSMPNSVSNEPVNPDWRTMFFNHARDISDQTMREVWGQVLASEVAKPGTYSMRTLEVLRVMSGAEAEAFARFCNLVFEPDYAVRMDSGLDEFGVSFNDILALQSAGVLRENEIAKHLPKHGAALPGRCLMVTHDFGVQVFARQRQLSFSVHMLTRAGRELRRLIQSQANLAYVAAVMKDLSMSGVEVTPFPITREGELIRAGGKLYRPDDL